MLTENLVLSLVLYNTLYIDGLNLTNHGQKASIKKINLCEEPSQEI